MNNPKKIFTPLGASNHSLTDREDNDFYATDPRALLLKWDNDSPVTFHSDGHTVHHFDLRFQAEDEGRVPTDRKFRWKMLNL